MKYITVEGLEDENEKLRATGKARADVEVIAESLGYQKLPIPTVFGSRMKKTQKLLQFIDYYNNAKKWNKIFKNLSENDTVIIQYPLINISLHFEKLIEKYKDKLNIIILVHDLQSVRFGKDEKKSKAFLNRVNNEDKLVLTYASGVISHNAKMTKYLKTKYPDINKIVNLEIFDYLSEDKAFAKIDNSKSVIIAGNLGSEKAPYLKDLKKVPATFRLYGINFDKKCSAKNVSHEGAFKPDELIENLRGSYGLVWDGASIDLCSGVFGNYLRYNNPHKTSLYLSAGLPVIIWKEAALADFIEKNKVGFSVGSLKEIPEKLQKISEKEYRKMQENTEKIAKKLKSGYYLTEAIKKVEK